MQQQRGTRNGAGASCCDNPGLILSVNTKPCSWLLLSSARLWSLAAQSPLQGRAVFLGGVVLPQFQSLNAFFVWEPMLNIVATVT